MKKLIQLFVAIFLISGIILFALNRLNTTQGYSGKNVLNIYNWGDYIDPELIDQFEKESGIKVVYQTFDSNEAMLTKIEQGGTTYDIAVPSDYAIAKMIEEDLVLPIDQQKIPNLKNIDPRFLDLSFDPGNKYSIPYFWGTVGIVYNQKLIDGKKPTSWKDIWDPALKNQILLADGAREVMGMSLNSLGYSLNETDETKLQEAKANLMDLTPNVKAIVGDEIKLLLANEEAGIGVVWSGDANEIMSENENLNYVIPKEGSNVWFDNVVIPKTAKNVKGAHEFINFMLDPKNAAKNADYVGYSTPNKAALKLLDRDVREDKRFYPDKEVTDTLEVYENLGKEMLAHYNELFLEFKMHKK
ncbi:extracellular solute-binding protein family 1 [Exiguobacterium sibiricum 255-15]|uniref:Extracellular solute-binding protein family 1 n=1 Tax=Exiguobacterium sibiricum (strain DSM 17290 / CCUG 55495 / CIP 109462 / JCM 13490 / 255-15) TaxID=262543 RepID=B1YM14_EXIS2|nr:ABC transporter substrate-binding protein [Exiguobacterium sibiricum]ACB61972.1 extracellular solute-binding protein family 1 [Exiguobacterium sibiricum 255-15]